MFRSFYAVSRNRLSNQMRVLPKAAVNEALEVRVEAPGNRLVRLDAELALLGGTLRQLIAGLRGALSS